MSERILYFDCFSGLAGDMTLGAMVDLGLDIDALKTALESLPVEGWTLETRTRSKMGIRGVDVHIEVGGETEGPAVTVDESGHGAHGHGHDEGLGAHHAEANHDPHSHDHAHHRHYADIVRIIEGGALPPVVVERALAAFDVIAEAEARVHGVEKAAVHFHEVGAVDSIIDIVGVSWGLYQLGIDRVESAPPPMGRGFMRCAHGKMPLPAPATLEILKGLPIAPCPLERELVTPTGAAFLRAWADRVGGFPEMVVEGVGWGAGNADFPDRPNLLRLVLGRTDPATPDCYVVETNLDDLNPEWAGYVLEKLFDAGVLDAWFVPLHMKKNRPGIMVGALVDLAHRDAVEALLLAESSAIGLRRYPVRRNVLPRRMERVETPFGTVTVKVAHRDGSVLNAAPEYEDCARVARTHGVPLKTVYQHAVAAYLATRPES